MADNHAPGFSVATCLFFIWSILFFTVRAWVKSRHSEVWAWDDTIISAALVVALLHVVTSFMSINAGYGTSVFDLVPAQRAIVEKTIYASQIFYVLSVGLVKISTGLFVTRLSRHGKQVHSANVVIALSSLWTVVATIVVSLRGDLKHPWSSLDGSQTLFGRWVGIEVSGLALEVALWSVCVSIIWSLSMPLIKRLLVLAIFGCRLLLIPIVTVRLIYLSPSQNTLAGTTNETANIFTEAALEFAIISACVTCLKPFFQTFHPDYVVSAVNTDNTWHSANTGKTRDAYHRLSAVSESGRLRSAARSSMRDEAVSLDVTKRFSKQTSGTSGRSLRPDQFDQFATISASRRSSSDDITLGVDKMIIRKTETWSVRIEEEMPVVERSSQDGVTV